MRLKRGGSANFRCRKVNSHGLADPPRLQETFQGCKRHERDGSANLRCWKVNSHGLADLARHERVDSANLRCRKVNSRGLANPARLQEARARWLGELAVQESKLARVSRPGKVARGQSEVARRTCGAGK
ncbi:hypothetical protein CRG98_034689 [Punica granatum]|uniref:Uncharacterized protein n=1 Tax=Punica granatum TaxID=22663 RepID=A0A2I0ILP4_PUNGR|nr:hypothetical protein CRG98_034689 [Punica granatum]